MPPFIDPLILHLHPSLLKYPKNNLTILIESSYKSLATGTSAGIPFFSHIFATVDGFSQSFIDPIVHIAEISH
jgi:hypothetical protein